jgi:CheY-like chemotaxis protein
LTEWLRGEGHEVVGANWVDEALVVLSSRIEIDVVVTDVRMPGVMDGLKLTRRIRSDSHPTSALWELGRMRTPRKSWHSQWRSQVVVQNFSGF